MEKEKFTVSADEVGDVADVLGPILPVAEQASESVTEAAIDPAVETEAAAAEEFPTETEPPVAIQSVAPATATGRSHRIHNFLIFREGGEDGIDEVVGSLKEALALFGRMTFRGNKITSGVPTVSCGDVVVAVLENFVLGDWKIL